MSKKTWSACDRCSVRDCWGRHKAALPKVRPLAGDTGRLLHSQPARQEPTGKDCPSCKAHTLPLISLCPPVCPSPSRIQEHILGGMKGAEPGSRSHRNSIAEPRPEDGQVSSVRWNTREVSRTSQQDLGERHSLVQQAASGLGARWAQGQVTSPALQWEDAA